MKLLAVTQRIGLDPDHGERRDMLDRRWPAFLRTCGFAVLPVPNEPEVALELMRRTSPRGVLFSGGNDLVAYGGDAPERDATETQLLCHAIETGLPVLGVCRGLQFLMDAFGSPLEKVTGHVATRHEVSGDMGTFEANSFHAWGAFTVAAPLVADGRAHDGTIEAVHHHSAAIQGIMWHPEREARFEDRDIRLIKRLFGG